MVSVVLVSYSIHSSNLIFHVHLQANFIEIENKNYPDIKSYIWCKFAYQLFVIFSQASLGILKQRKKFCLCYNVGFSQVLHSYQRKKVYWYGTPLSTLSVCAVHISTLTFYFLSLFDDTWMFLSPSSSGDRGTESPDLGMYIWNTCIS